jgi:hypothetical protein
MEAEVSIPWSKQRGIRAAVKIQFEIFCSVTPYKISMFLPEDGGSIDLRNVGILLQHYTMSQPWRTRLEPGIEHYPEQDECSSNHISILILYFLYISRIGSSALFWIWITIWNNESFYKFWYDSLDMEWANR